MTTPARRTVAALLAVLGLLLGSLSLASPTFASHAGTHVGTRTVAAMAAERRDANCSDFSSQAAAQHYYIAHGGPQSDPDGLDSDGDGVACESNPCPCDYSTGGGGGGGAPPVHHQPATLHQYGRVTRVVDGDTIDVRLVHGGTPRIRLLGIDTPEVYGGTQCYGPQASTATKRILPVGTRVSLTSDPTQDLKDRYGRLLRYVGKGSTDVDRFLVRGGFARVYVYDHHPFQRTRSYQHAQADARAHHRGLWGHC